MWKLAVPLVAALLSSCATLDRELALGVADTARDETLAFRADPTFAAGMSGREWRRLARAEARALDFVSGGNSLPWGQPNARARGTVEVSQPFAVGARECRRFRHAVTVRGRRDTVTGVACREGQEPWSYVS